MDYRIAICICLHQSIDLIRPQVKASLFEAWTAAGFVPGCVIPPYCPTTLVTLNRTGRWAPVCRCHLPYHNWLYFFKGGSVCSLLTLKDVFLAHHGQLEAIPFLQICGPNIRHLRNCGFVCKNQHADFLIFTVAHKTEIVLRRLIAPSQ